MLRSRTFRTILVGGVLAAVLAAIAVAAIPDSSGVIHGCYRQWGGDLRLVQKASDCRKHEQAISWNQKGPAGPPGPPGPPGNGNVAFDEKAAETTVSSTTPVESGGPSVTVNVPASGVISVWARAQMKPGSFPNGGATVVLHDEPAATNTPLLAVGSVSAFQGMWTSPGCCSGVGVENAFQAGWVVLEATPGQHTFSLRYAASGGSSSATFRQRKLVVKPAG